MTLFKKISILSFFIILFQFSQAQNEFVTVWKPALNTIPTVSVDAPAQATSNQIWFPGIGENYTIQWEEVGFPQHNGTMADVTSVKQVLIDFGPSSNPDPSLATYRVKVKNGNGIFKQIRFGEAQLISGAEFIIPFWVMFGSSDKITAIEQWGNISWVSMNSAFANCKLLTLTADDAPNLSNVTDASFMFMNTTSFTGAVSMQNWDTSHIQDFSFMFARLNEMSQLPDQFNPPYFDSWNMIAAQNLRYMFMSRIYFNQSLNSWNVSNVKNMSWMFGATSFNQRLDKWDTSNVERMDYMFHGINTFNQSLQTWDTSKVINMAHMFHYCTAFNQPLNSWDVSKVTNMSLMLNGATSFNQSLANWKLNPSVNAGNFLYNTALSCENYSKTLVGWADDPNTPNNINISLLSPLTYAANIIPKRNILINKGWILTGDAAGSCFLATSENTLKKSGGIYPNPVQDNIHVEDFSDVFDFKILDTAGRLLKSGKTDSDEINVSALPKGIYILQIISKDKMQSFKFIKK